MIIYIKIFLVTLLEKCVLSFENITSERLLLTVGVIASKGTDNSIVPTEIKHGQVTVELLWQHVDDGESFQVFKAVKRLDELGNVSFIVLADYDPSALNEQVLKTSSKPLVKWKRRPNTMKTAQTKGTTEPFITLAGKREEPHCELAIGANQTQKSNYFHVGLSPTAIIPRALSQFCRYLQWTSVFVFHESATELETRAVIDTLSMSEVLTTVHNVDHVTDINRLVLEIYSSTAAAIHEINFVVICRINCVTRILKTANYFDDENADQKTWLKQFSRWLVMLFDHKWPYTAFMKDVAYDLDNVVVMAIPEVTFPPSENIPQAMRNVIVSVEADYPNTDDTEGLLAKGLATWLPATRCTGFHVDTLLWTADGREFSSVASVTMEGNVETISELFPNTNYGYSKRQFIVGTLPYPPFVIKRKENGTDVYEGTFIELLKELAVIMNFTYKMVEPEDGMWGGFIDKENLIFNGLVGQLQRKEADFVAAPLVIQADRDIVVDFSYTIHHEYSAILQKKPDPRANKWKTLLNPFKTEVLISIGLSLFLVTVLAFLIERYSHYYHRAVHAETRKAEGGLHTLLDSFWYMYGALLYQGGVYLPRSMAGRTFISTWWLFCVVVVGIYCGNLIAFLTVTRVKPPFNTLQEMVDMKGGMTWGTLGGTFWEVVFETSNTAIFRKIGDGIKEFTVTDPGVLHLHTDYHINKVKQGGYAWIGDKTTMEVAMAKECDLLMAKEEFLPMRYAFAFQGNSPHTAMFSKQIMKCHEGGLMEMWKRKWWPKSNFCSSKIVPEAKAITLEDVQSAFYICVMGAFVGLVAFFVELIVFRCRRQRADSGRSIEADDASSE